jgi:REP element-mobilizing transposase RayT
MPHRRNLRRVGYNYGSAGTYFVTLVLEDRIHRFGTPSKDRIELNTAGHMVASTWLSMPDRFSDVELDDFVVMPDHFHGVVMLGTDPARSLSTTLGQVMAAFKSITTVEYGRGVRERGWQQYDRQLWMGNYYDRILRDETELDRVRLYMERNPAKLLERWEAIRDG